MNLSCSHTGSSSFASSVILKQNNFVRSIEKSSFAHNWQVVLPCPVKGFVGFVNQFSYVILYLEMSMDFC